MAQRTSARVLAFALASSLVAQGAAPSLTFDEANGRAKEPRRLSLRYADFLTNGPLPELPAELQAPPATDGESRYWIVQLAGTHGEEQKALVASTGLELLDYVPNYAFVARGTKAQLAAAKALPGVAWTGPLHPAYRIDPELLARDEAARGRFVVLAFAGVGGDALRAQ